MQDLFEKSQFKKWIKLINKNECIDINNYNRKELFIPIADIILDKEINSIGKKKRTALIRFVPIIPIKDFNEKNEWIYLFTIDNYIVKIGGTRTGIKSRIISYLCGHYTQEQGKSGNCSNTNAFIYNTFLFYLTNDNSIIKMFGYKFASI